MSFGHGIRGKVSNAAAPLQRYESELPASRRAGALSSGASPRFQPAQVIVVSQPVWIGLRAADQVSDVNDALLNAENGCPSRALRAH